MTAAALNEMAWQLAEKGAALDKARGYSQASLDKIAAVLRDARLESLDQRHRESMASIAAYWDTMGWVRFKAGELASAETYLNAAFALNQDSEVAEHLGAVLEKQGRLAPARQMYARAAASRPARAGGRQALARLGVAGNDLESLVETERGKLVAERTLKLPKLAAGKAEGAALLLVGPDGLIRDARFRGNKALEPLQQSLVGKKVQAAAPDSTSTPLLRFGAVSCGPDVGCTMVLMLAEEATRATP